MDKSIGSDNHQVFFELLVETREHAGLTQVDLAERLDTDQSTISKYERGQRRIDLIQLQKICSELDVSVTDFVAEFESRISKKRKRRKRRR